MKRLLLPILILVFQTALGQINFSGGGKILVHGGGKIIIENPTPGGITWVAGGGIITADETSQVILRVGESVGEYRVPFVTLGGHTIPFSYDIQTAGVGGGSLVLSSWAVSEDGLVNTLTGGPGLPAGVTSFTTENEWGNWAVQGGYKVMNRFWRIDPIGYTVKPEGVYEFTYHLSEKPAQLAESELTAQRWNSIEGTWLDWLYAPTANLAAKTVSVTVQNPEDQFPIWTLTDISDPLPVELARFVGDCGMRVVELAWTTWSEIDNDHFVIQFSIDASQWYDMGLVEGAGYSSTVNHYSFQTEQHSGLGYYRLAAVSPSAGIEYSPVIAVTCDVSPGEIRVWPNPTSDRLEIQGAPANTATVRDSRSRVVSVPLTPTGLSMIDLAAGTYTVSFPTGKTFLIIKQ